jgi:N-acetylglucosamine-6-sulfatase
VAPEQPLDGRSLVPVLKGEPKDWRSSFLIEYFSDTVFPRIHKMGYQAVRTERHKYIHYTDLEGMDELYDLGSDPYELRNLIGSPGHAADLSELRGELGRLLAASSLATPAR